MSLSSFPIRGLLTCRDCKVNIYSLTCRGIIDNWEQLCPQHRIAARLAAQSMLKDITELALKT